MPGNRYLDHKNLTTLSQKPQDLGSECLQTVFTWIKSRVKSAGENQ